MACSGCDARRAWLLRKAQLAQQLAEALARDAARLVRPNGKPPAPPKQQ